MEEKTPVHRDKYFELVRMRTMKRPRHILTFLSFISILSWKAPVIAQEESSNRLLLQIRPRSEWRDGYNRLLQPGDVPELYTNQRTRMTWEHKEDKWEFRLGFQGVRLFGDLSGDDGAYGSTSVAESWGAWKPREKTKITIGRQIIAFDTERIVGAVDWSLTGRFLDGVRLDQSSTLGTTTAALTWDAPAGMTRVMVHQSKEIKTHRISLLHFSQLNSANPDASTHTTGATWSMKPTSGWWALTEAYGQRTGSSDQFVFMGVMEFGYTSQQLGNLKLGVDWLESDRRVRAFNPFLGTNHRHYGWMDHFYVGGLSNGMTNAHVEWKRPLGKKEWNLDGDVRYHQFFTASVDERLAHEWDAVLVFHPTQFVNCSFGWSWMKSTTAMYEYQDRTQPSSAWQQWGWVQLNFTPQIQW